MADPYGIQQVNIPALLGMHQQVKQQRIADMMRAREYELAERKAEREDKRDAALAKVFSAKGGDPQSGGTGVAMQPPASSAPDSSPSLPALDQPLPPRTDGLTINMGALQELYAIDPQGASQIQKLVHDSNEQQLKAATARGEAMAVAASALKSVPPSERQAQFQSRWAPFLAERGWTPELISRADLSDQSLDAYYRQGMSIQQIIQQDKPDYRVLPAGATLYDVRKGNTVTQNNAPPATLPPDFDFGDGGPTPSASGTFPGN